MKHTKILSMLCVAVFTGSLLGSCAKGDEIAEAATEKTQKTTTIDAVALALQGIPGIADVRKEVAEGDDAPIYFFTFTQPANHFKPEAGTFKQRVALRYRGVDDDVVLYTNGYAMGSTANQIRTSDLVRHMKANMLCVEHRYFGGSYPGLYDNLDYTYFNAEQAACDLHAIVQALRKNMFTAGKWVSTGVSKDGITTALYAYYSDKHGWNDIDVYMPFCAPFMLGSTDSEGNYSCNDFLTGTYLENVCGSGYPEGSVEAVAYQRLRSMPYYICTSPELRRACIRQSFASYVSYYKAIMDQYNEASPNSTGDVEKDLTALAIYIYYANLFSKFAYLPFSSWASLVPDPVVASSADASDDDIWGLAEFLVMGNDGIYKKLQEQSAHTRGNDDRYWELLQMLRNDSAASYDVQSFMELGYADLSYTLVDGNYLTSQQVYDVVYRFTRQARFEGLYNQDGGQLMTDFRQWVYTERTAPIIFVYAHNDPWTGAAIDDAAAQQNPLIEKIVDPISTHDDSFLTEVYTASSRQAIISALDKYLNM